MALPALRGERWSCRPRLSWLIRALVLLAPLGASIAAGVLTSRGLTGAHGSIGTFGSYAIVLVTSMAVLVAVDRIARRLLPLAVLLRLTIVFPDDAPSRLAVALRAGSARRLGASVDAARRDTGDLNPETVLTLAAALNAHDRRTRGHSERVRALTDLVVEELGLAPDDAERLRWAAFLHDVGKLNVPAQVLNKPGKLDGREWRLIREHPEHGEIFAVPMAEWLGEWMHAIGQHHERFDGTGYPDGLRGSEISLAGRIVAVTDSFETMTAVRSYNRPKTPKEARDELVRCSGTHFDPDVVRGFLNISIGRLRWTVGLASWIAQLPLIGMSARAGAQMVTTAAGVQASTGSVVGALAVAVAGVATPLAPAAAAAAVITESRAHEQPSPSRSRLGDPPFDQTATGTPDDTTPDAKTAKTDETTATPGANPDRGGPGGGDGPGNGSGQGNGGPGGGDGPGNGAGQGQGNGHGNGHGGGSR